MHYSHSTDFENLYKATFETVSQHVFFKVEQLSDAQDIVQNVYKDFYVYVTQKGKVIDNVLAYLIQMANHELQKYYQHKQSTFIHNPQLEEDWIESIADPHDLEVSTFNRFELEDILKEIQRLSPQDQKILGAKFRYELSFKEIAQHLNHSENTIKTRYYRALSQLKDRLKNHEK